MKHFHPHYSAAAVMAIVFLWANIVDSFNIQRGVMISKNPIVRAIYADADADQKTYRLYTSTNQLEMLIDHEEHFQLILDPELNGTDQALLTRFDCEDSESKSESFNWTVLNTNCKVLTIKPSFDFTFDTNENAENPKNITIVTLKPGKQQLVAHTKWINEKNETKNQPKINIRKAYIVVNVGRSDAILLISTIIGWIYFVAWSVSFYPQIWDNFKRKSVVGLNFDFVALNITGFISYSMFNVSLYFISSVQKEFEDKNPRSQIPVQLNDVVFGVHAAFATLICIVQCFLYERGEQTISLFCKIFLGIVWSGYVILGILVAATNVITFLTYLYIFSYVKLVITIIKYIPQGYFNFKRKSTIGWSIGNIFLDFTGGSLSMAQMFLLAYNYDDWVTIFKNFTKFGLGFVSIMFDVFFILQHYVFYRHNRCDSESLLVGPASPNRNNNGVHLANDNISFNPSINSNTNAKKLPLPDAGKKERALYGSTDY